MSPTSYQTAPPRIVMITTVQGAVKPLLALGPQLSKLKNLAPHSKMRHPKRVAPTVGNFPRMKGQFSSTPRRCACLRKMSPAVKPQSTLSREFINARGRSRLTEPFHTLYH